MRTYVITGGTDGMGKGMGLHLLGRGDRVIAVASGETKGKAFLAEAASIGASDRATFLRADLSTLSGMRKVVAGVESECGRLDGLVFGAQRFRPQREETLDGLEFTFALAYLSRAVIGEGLLSRLEASPAGVHEHCGPWWYPRQDLLARPPTNMRLQRNASGHAVVAMQ